MRDITNPPAIVAKSEDEKAARINALHESAERKEASSLEDKRQCGLLLLEQKAACKHGEWLPWLKANVKFDERTARRYMELAKSDVTSDLLADEWRRIQGNTAPVEEEPAPPAPTYLEACERESAARGDYQEAERIRSVRQTYYSPPEAVDDPRSEPEQEPHVCPWCHEEWSPGHDCLNPKPATHEPPARLPLPTVQAAAQTAKPSWGEAFTLDRWEAMSRAEKDAALAKLGNKRFNDQGQNEGIQWALWSWNPVTGCRHNCPFCYARDIANRFYETKFEPALWPERLSAPANTPLPEARIAAEQNPARRIGLGNVFTCSMADLFGRWVPSEWIELVLASIRSAPQWNFILLTKFPQRMAEFDFPGNVWAGTSIDQQARVANAERAFRKIKAKVKWLSCEPLLEPLRFADIGAFDWVVLGGASESTQTPEWKPPQQWVNDIVASCRAAGVKVYQKPNLTRLIQEYPGFDIDEPQQAPESLRYLPEMKQ